MVLILIMPFFHGMNGTDTCLFRQHRRKNHPAQPDPHVSHPLQRQARSYLSQEGNPPIIETYSINIFARMIPKTSHTGMEIISAQTIPWAFFNLP